MAGRHILQLFYTASASPAVQSFHLILTPQSSPVSMSLIFFSVSTKYVCVYSLSINSPINLSLLTKFRIV